MARRRRGTPGRSTRVVARLLDVDEGGGDRCRDRRASWIMHNLATQSIEAVTRLEVTRRGDGRGLNRVASSVADTVVFYNLSLSKARNQGKTDITASLVEEVRPRERPRTVNRTAERNTGGTRR